MMPITVAHLISSGGFYGAERCLLNLAIVQMAQGCRVMGCVFENAHNPHTEVAAKLQAAGVETRVVMCRKRIDLRTVLAIRHFLSSEHVAILHCHGYKADSYGYIAALVSKVKLVSTCHNWCRDTEAAKYQTVDKFILRSFDTVVAISTEVADILIRSGVAPGKVHVIENGVPLGTPFPRGNDRGVKQFTFATIARLAPDKRVDDFLLAAAAVVRKHPEAQFLVVGDGSERSRLKALTASLSLSRQVTFTGYITDLSHIYSMVDAVVLASLNEGMPMSLLEAMAACKPVIATRVGGIPNIVADRVNGLLVNPGDPPALAAAMNELVEDSGLTVSLGLVGRTTVEERFSAKQMADRYLILYKALNGEVSIPARATIERSLL